MQVKNNGVEEGAGITFNAMTTNAGGECEVNFHYHCCTMVLYLWSGHPPRWSWRVKTPMLGIIVSTTSVITKPVVRGPQKKVGGPQGVHRKSILRRMYTSQCFQCCSHCVLTVLISDASSVVPAPVNSEGGAGSSAESGRGLPMRLCKAADALCV